MYRISQLAERSGVPASTLRFYEQAGLLTAARSAAGYRLYDDTALGRLEFIASGKRLGLPLDEIRDLLAVWDQGVCASVRDQLRPMIAARIAEADRRVAELTAFSERLTELHDQLGAPAPVGACGPGCGCVTAATPPGPVMVELTTPAKARATNSEPFGVLR
ncbi:MerR family transcriptional regulator [Kribbella qitaiheensis]|nr:MerR family transcriptional regulator [Kribbella qitaiheensis]